MKNKYFFQSIKNALSGIQYFFLTERNGQIQSIAAFVVVVSAILLDATVIEWIVLLFCITMVLCFEMVNTALEYLCNVVHKEHHPVIKQVKDIAAGAVLTATLISCIIGLLFFLPKLLNQFS
ncbi:MAG: diacylglycerol kinase family protein [Chitinophagaceae bacterium]|nr:diacylglycerol kinase family protein [Chitinophagaceae bacterium]